MPTRCVVHLPYGALSDADVLLRAAAVPLGVPARCRFPGPHSGQLPGPSSPLMAPSDDHGSNGRWPDIDWGVVNDARTVTIKALGIELEIAGALTIEHAAELDRELNVWAARLQGWLAALAGGPTGYMWSSGFVSWPDKIGFDLQSKAYMEGKFHEPERLSMWAWQHALEHSRDQDQPPLSHFLLATAVANQVNEDYRAAVIDASTATEVALNEGIANYVRHRGADASISEALLKNKTLGALVQLAKKFLLALPPNVKPDLVEIRNRVAHGGYAPSCDDAKEAVRIAHAIVEELDPLPAHCDETAQL